MKTAQYRGSIVMAIAVAAMLFVGCGQDSDPVSSNNGSEFSGKGTNATAQSIGVALNDLATDIVIDVQTSTTWNFDRDCARDHYMVTAKVGNIDPATENAAFVAAINNSKCTFWNGGTLLPYTKATGNKSVTVSPKPGMSIVGAHTCWNGTVTEEGGSGQADVTIQPDIAGESVVTRASGPFKKKFSFSLLDAEGYTRITNVTYYFEKWDGTDWVTLASNSVGDLTDVESGAFDFMYIANGGSFGTAISSLVSGHTQGDIMDNAGGISGDDFAGNNSNVTGSETNAMVAHGPAWTNTVSDAGSYRVRVAGTVKGNDGMAAQTFAVTSNAVSIDIGAPSCD